MKRGDWFALPATHHAPRVTLHPPLATRHGPAASGFTLVEVMVATVVTLILMGLVVTLFGFVGDSVADTRAAIQMNDQLRSAKLALQTDLAGATAEMIPPLKPEDGLGYLEYIEGPVSDRRVGYTYSAEIMARTFDEDKDGNGPDVDNTAGDYDDILMLTTRNANQTFVGRYFLAGGGDSIATESQVAEVCWFLRGHTLYRRVLLVKPAMPMTQALFTQAGYYRFFDISAHQEGGALDRNPAPTSTTNPPRMVANSLGDLTRREYRYGHQPYVYPHDARFWNQLRLPTLRECSAVDATATPQGMWPFPQVENTNTAAAWGVLPGGATTVASTFYAGDPKSQLIVPAGVTLGFIGQPGAAALTRDPVIVLTPPVAGEPFTDSNGNGARDATESYTDSNGNGLFDDGAVFDIWNQPSPWTEMADPTTAIATPYLQPYGTQNTRFSEDVMLNNVLAFDVKAWDPTARVLLDASGLTYAPGDPDYPRVFSAWVAAGLPVVNVVSQGAYVDLNYLSQLGAASAAVSAFSGPGDGRSGVQMIYDTWSDHYERDGYDQNLDGVIDSLTNGFDDDGVGGVDNGDISEPFVDVNYNGVWDLGEAYTDTNGNSNYDFALVSEREAPPPYRTPLRGLQIKIRVFEPDSRQIREVTIVQEFLP